MIIKTGLDLLDSKWPSALKGAGAGLLFHPASINRKLELAVDCLFESKKLKLKALFGPQHGVRGETQDNMIEWKGFRDRATGLPVYSLYSETRIPGTSMLKDIDALVIDLQDVGARYYTFIWTMELCMKACEEAGKSVVILDRPNPVCGTLTEGPVLDPGFASFVGQRPLTVRHGMTIGEIGNYLGNEFYPDLDLHIISLQGWKRDMFFSDTCLPWVLPSPNMPTLDTALVYPGMCLLEGTNLSEGRGTSRPFEIFGAPFIDPEKLTAVLSGFRLPGVRFRPMHFEPTFQKHAGKLCGGAQIHVTSRSRFKPFKTGIAIIKAVKEIYPKHFKWKQPPYEYEKKKMPIDILCGTDRVRKDIESEKSLTHMEGGWTEECREFNRKIMKRYLLY